MKWFTIFSNSTTYISLSNIYCDFTESKKTKEEKNSSAKNTHSQNYKKNKNPESAPALNRQTLAFIVDYLNLCNKKTPFLSLFVATFVIQTQQTEAKNKLQYRNLLTLCVDRNANETSSQHPEKKKLRFSNFQ